MVLTAPILMPPSILEESLKIIVNHSPELLGLAFQLWGMAFLFCGAAFALTYTVAKTQNNYAVVDVVWGFLPALVIGFLMWLALSWQPNQLLIEGLWLVPLVCLHAIRLGAHLGRRFLKGFGHNQPEDPRYAVMREKWGLHFEKNMAGAYAMQATLMGLLCLPWCLILAQPAVENTLFTAWGITGLLLWGLGFSVASLSDEQLTRFKQQDTSGTQVCQDGLWFYSRHPNMLGEWLCWLGYAVMALTVPFGWLGLLAPTVFLYVLWFWTGIRPTEEQALRGKRAEAYRLYQKMTPVFFPRLF